MSEETFLAPCTKTTAERSVFQSTGILKVIIQSAHIDSGVRWCLQPPSPFVVVQGGFVFQRTKTRDHTYDPSWLEETLFLLVSSADENVKLKVYDAHRHWKNRLLGVAVLRGGTLDTQLALLRRGQKVGDLSCSAFYYPAEAADDGSETGIARLTLHRVEGLAQPPVANGCNAFGLPATKLRALVRLDWDERPIFATKKVVLKDGVAAWELAHEFLCRKSSTCKVNIEVWNETRGEQVGLVHIGLMEMVEAERASWPLAGTSVATVKASAEWRRVTL
ncbi:hypothetical protein MIND_00450600 [Mycena indigotica]|uniref:C2 domain-containing protein n=1 Tax=Mycena indigotica TaxID=2126181 RepID=A0A8H6SWJ5_9AGAR|nr:uncharacterized protein MIND_00450600 [Mycena indigotica]KAF7306593.1 hypothetical protein MIND_00450600 [Mycena indigotica]